MIYHQNVKDGIVKLMNRNKRYVSLFNSTVSNGANLGKTSVKFRYTASLPRQERSVNLRIDHSKTSENG